MENGSASAWWRDRIIIAAMIGAIAVIIAAMIGRVPKAQAPDTKSQQSDAKLEIKQLDTSCRSHPSKYCGLPMSIRWENVPTNEDYYIYAVGYSPGYEKPYWIAGTGIRVSTSRGSSVITDGAYGKPGHDISVFACLTKDAYKFSIQPTFEFFQKPSCDKTSAPIQIQYK